MIPKERITPECVEHLEPNEIFVFGSNREGEHVGGAAMFALERFGAENGNGVGFQGQSYAIPTCVRLTDKNGVRYTKPYENVELMSCHVSQFYKDAMRHKDKKFYVTKIGCGIAGFSTNEIAELFRHCIHLKNVCFPIEFWHYWECFGMI